MDGYSKIGIFTDDGRRYCQQAVRIIDLRKYSTCLEDQNSVYVNESGSAETGNPQSTRYGCTYCSFQCGNLNEQRIHFQSDWHLCNLRRRIKSKPAISEDQYERIIAGEQGVRNDENGDTSSSSSDENDDRAQSRNTAKFDVEDLGIKAGAVVFVTNDDQVVSVHRSVLTSLRSYQVSNEALLSALHSLHSKPCIWIVLILSGGHFAGAVFDSSRVDGEAVVHKTIHRYTIRAKQGCSQSVRDAQQQSKPKSAGANLRRYNEAALCKDIRNLLIDWNDHVRAANAIFLRCSVYKRHIFYGGVEPVLSKYDERIRNIPFDTRKPTYEETKRTWTQLATLVLHGSCQLFLQSQQSELTEMEAMDDLVTNVSNVRIEEKDPKKNGKQAAPTGMDSSSKKAPATPRKSRGKQPEEQEMAEEFALPRDLRQALYTSCKRGDAESIRRIVEGRLHEEYAVLDYLSSPVNHRDGSTFLHLASASGHLELLRFLLGLGCDPTMKNTESQVPFQVANGKNTRQCFTQFRQDYPDRWDWNKAQIPEPLAPEMEAARKALQAERRKAAQKLKAERMKAKKEEDAKMKAEENEKRRFLQLSDREKRALAAERRWMNQVAGNDGVVGVDDDSSSSSVVLSRCFRCGLDITGKVPFEYSGNRFCSMKCLKEHRSLSDR